MGSNSKKIEMLIEKQETGSLIEARRLYYMNRGELSEAAFFKSLERMCKEEKIVRVANGIYFKPNRSKYGIVPVSETDIVDYYTRDLSGIVIGYKLYNRVGISTQISKRTEVFSNIVIGDKKTIQNVTIRKLEFEFDKDSIPIIETLEILQNYSNIEDLNNTALSRYLLDFSVKYNDKAAAHVLTNIKYKKSTIAFLEACLNYMGIENTLKDFLSALSVYKIPSMEEIYEAA